MVIDKKLLDIMYEDEIIKFKFADDDNIFSLVDLDQHKPQAIFNETHGYFMTLAEIMKYIDDEVTVL
jgi:hypothetical protein